MKEHRTVTMNMGIKSTERLVEFCYPGFVVKAEYPPSFSLGDISIPFLRKKFEAHNEESGLYSSFDEFLDSLRKFIPGTIEEKGIYVNITYTSQAIHDVIKLASA